MFRWRILQLPYIPPCCRPHTSPDGLFCKVRPPVVASTPGRVPQLTRRPYIWPSESPYRIRAQRRHSDKGAGRPYRSSGTRRGQTRLERSSGGVGQTGLARSSGRLGQTGLARFARWMGQTGLARPARRLGQTGLARSSGEFLAQHGYVILVFVVITFCVDSQIWTLPLILVNLLSSAGCLCIMITQIIYINYAIKTSEIRSKICRFV
jgi:hypothetical protein